MSYLPFIDGNLRVALRFFGEATGNGSVTELDGATAIASGLDYGVFNIALLSRRVEGEARLREVVRECASHFRGRSARWSMWLCDDLMDTVARRRARFVLLEAGLREISRAPGMAATSLAPLRRSLPDIELRAIDSEISRRTFGEVTATCFDIPLTISRAIYDPERAWQGAYQGYVAFSAGRPVAATALVKAGGSLGVYSLGTMPEFRGQGYGEALVRAAVKAHGPTSEPLVLQSTEAGRRLYRRLGFSDQTSFTIYLTK